MVEKENLYSLMDNLNLKSNSPQTNAYAFIMLLAARYLNLRIQGAKFILVGTDGGLIEKAIYKEELFLSPASRVEVFNRRSKRWEF